MQRVKKQISISKCFNLIILFNLIKIEHIFFFLDAHVQIQQAYIIILSEIVIS